MHKSSPRETPPRSCPISQDRVGEETPPRHAKSSNQRFPRKAPITGRRRRLADESGAPGVELSTFGHFAARTANTGERSESKSAGQMACVLPAAAQLPGPFAAKCPKVAILFALDGEVSVSLGAPVLVRAAPQREVRPHTLRLDTLVRGRGKRIEKLLAISLAHEPRIRQHEHARVA